MNELDNILSTINKVVNTDEILETVHNSQSVKSYYKTTTPYYIKYHSPDGAMHFPIYDSSNPYGVKDAHYRGLNYQAEYISKVLSKRKSINVLEVGCGQGYNLKYLAKKYPEIRFTGLDLSENNLDLAKKNCQHQPNISFVLENFDNLNQQNVRYDLIYFVESFCYFEIKNVLKILSNISNSDTKVIVFDLFSNKNPNQMTETEKKAINLLAKGYAVNRWQEWDLIKNELENNNFSYILTNLSNGIFPNIRRIHKKAITIFKYYRIIRFMLFTKIVSKWLIWHMITGYLSYYLVNENGLTSYYLLHFTKKEISK